VIAAPAWRAVEVARHSDYAAPVGKPTASSASRTIGPAPAMTGTD